MPQARAHMALLGHQHAVDHVHHAVALAQVGRDHLDDVVNATFTTAWQRFDDIPTESALTWLLGTCRNHCRNQLRGQRRFAALADEIAAARPRIQADLERLGMPPEGVVAVERVVRTMSPSSREVFVLNAWFEMNSTEIADTIGMRAGAVRKRLHHIRRALGPIFDEHTPGGADD